jgi:hypothetical protein
MTEECGKTTLVREGRKEGLLYTPEPQRYFQKMGDVRSNERIALSKGYSVFH